MKQSKRNLPSKYSTYYTSIENILLAKKKKALSQVKRSVKARSSYCLVCRTCTVLSALIPKGLIRISGSVNRSAIYKVNNLLGKMFNMATTE